ncbi:MAG: VWA domain-containing protein [Armatimonadota bacterium]|nr:VWA domain-containing protein [Armatimonadota bacterium]
MSFLSPLSLLLFLPLGGAIVLLYLLKLKRKERVVSSVMLWRDAVADIQANAPFQKLKKNLLLFLQLAALLLLIMGVARPIVRTKGLTANRIVVILDSSASMQSTDVSPSRFGKAKTIALDTVRRMGSGDLMLVITAGAKTRVVSPFTSDKRALSAAISGLAPADTHCNMKQALVLAISLAAGQTGPAPRIVVLSDGRFGALTDLPGRNLRLDFVKIGRESDNVAITGIDSRKTLSGEQEVFIGLRSFSRRERSFNLEIYLNDQLRDLREETLKPGEMKQEMLGDVTGAGGRVTAKLDVRDDLAADNTGSVYLTRPRKISTLLVTKGNIFLQNALNLDPNTQLTRAESVPADFDKRRYDLVVFDQIAPPASLPPGGYLLVNTAAAQGPADLGAKADMPVIVGSDRRHPVGAYVDFAAARIAEGRYLKSRDWATTLVEATGGPLGVAGQKNGRRFVQLGFSLLDSDFPLRVGFPIFITNCLNWLVESNASEAGDSTRTGTTMMIDIPPNTRTITVEDPRGARRTLDVTQTPVAFENTDIAGVYKVRGKGVNKEFACNLASSEESNTEPKDVFAVEGKRFTATSKAVSTNREYYGYLILLALAVLCFEWYAYHRRL